MPETAASSGQYVIIISTLQVFTKMHKNTLLIKKIKKVSLPSTLRTLKIYRGT